MKQITRIKINALFLLVLIVSLVSGQYYPGTVKIPVTIFDYHSNKKCPDFDGMGGYSYALKNMVQDTLDDDYLPVRGDDTAIYANYHVNNWFRPSEEQKDIYLKPFYARSDNNPDFPTIRKGNVLRFDTTKINLYENIVIYDTLQFRHIGNGMYEFRDDSFFPIDSAGYGKEVHLFSPKDSITGEQYGVHNYAFSMMIQYDFFYRAGLVFKFKGDDDVWAFINKKQVLDLGGIHSAVKGDVNLDDYAEDLELLPKQKCRLSFFFSERRATASSCKITTNLIFAPPEDLIIGNENSDTLLSSESINIDTVKVGDTLYNGILIHSDTGMVSMGDLTGHIEWGVVDSSGIGKNAEFKLLDNDSSYIFIPDKAYTSFKIWSTYNDTIHYTDSVFYNDIWNVKDTTIFYNFTDTLLVYVLPGDAEKLTIEKNGKKPSGNNIKYLWEPDYIDTVFIDENEKKKDGFYCILRDKRNNWVGAANEIKWASHDSSIAVVDDGNESEIGEGEAIRITLSQDTCIYAEGSSIINNNLLTDSIVIKINSDAYENWEMSFIDTSTIADGLIDLIEITTNSNDVFNIEMIDILFAFIVDNIPLINTDNRKFIKPDRNDFVFKNGKIIISVEQDNDLPITYVLQDDVLKIPEIPISSIKAVKKQNLLAKDKITPIIDHAVFIPTISDEEEDTLIVIFSEPVNKIISDTLFSFKSALNTPYGMSLKWEIIKSANDTIYFSVDSMTKQFCEEGDSISLIENSGISDSFSNVQNKITYYRPIILKEYKMEDYDNIRLEYYDTSTFIDGTIDVIKFHLSDSVNLDTIAIKKIFESDLPTRISNINKTMRYFNEISYTDFVTNENGFDVSLLQNSQAICKTDVDNNDKLSIPKIVIKGTGTIYEQRITISDKLGIVPLRAEYYPDQEFTMESEYAIDTLLIELSEEIGEINITKPFQFINASNEKYTFNYEKEYEQEGCIYKFFVKKRVGEAVKTPQIGDSLWIKGNQVIIDKSGYSDKRRSISIPIIVGDYKKISTVKIVNPFSLSKDFKDKGFIIEIMIISEEELNNDLKLSGKIIDVTGNIVASFSELTKDNNNKFYSFWDCKNKNGRLVGIGSYLFLWEISLNGNKINFGKTTIGIKR